MFGNRPTFYYLAGDKHPRIVRTVAVEQVLAAIKADEVAYRAAANADRRALSRSLGIKRWWHR